MALVQVLFESHPGPAIPESDPELRAVLLDSLKTYEHEEAERPAFGDQPHIHVPEAAPSAGKLPAAPVLCTGMRLYSGERLQQQQCRLW